MYVGDKLLKFYYDGTRLAVEYNGNMYYYQYNVQGDVIALLNTYFFPVVQYTYSPWGYMSYVNDFNGNSNDPNSIANLNPFRYRGYMYDQESGFYYLNSRYYDPSTGRFINADGYVSTEQDLLGTNMFAYCANNPVNHCDPSGMFWKEIGQFFSSAWKGFVSLVTNTFGACLSSTATAEIIKDSNYHYFASSKTTEKTSTTTSKLGNSSKTFSVYANIDTTHPIKSSKIGFKFNIANYTLNISRSLDDLGTTISITNGDVTNSIALRRDMSELKVGIVISTTVKWDENTSVITSTSFDLNGIEILAFALAGQYYTSTSPSSSTAPEPPRYLPKYAPSF